ncbi:dynein regulatory complex protein 10 isoform X1 [Elgaria multicarinata webbii]|uniref:dynein regulatory complex protein 10 isoform X1 n=1 Tax=Elgaria multicarinata webbii TaxID=159646 RepID=UPI002FCD4863
MATEVLHQSYECIDPNRGKRQVYRMPLKILDPGRSKLTTVETKRIISVLDETILKVELVSTFSHVTENLEEFSAVLGPELTGALKEHLRLSNTMEATLARLEGEGVLQNGGAKGDLYGAEDPGGYLTLHVQGLRSSVRNIVRLFFANPMACQAVREVAHTRHPNANLFIKSLSELRGFLFEKLLTTPLEEKEKRRFMKEISQRDKKNMEIIAALMEELTAAIQNRDDEISRMNAAIKELKTHLHNLAKFSESQIQRTRTEAEKQQKGEARGSQAKCTKLQQELQLLRAQLSALIAEDRESELNLRKKKYKVEMEIENWVQKYDIEMIEKQEEIEEIDVVYTVEKAQLAELREKFALLDQEYSQIKEERRVRQEQREKAEKEMAILVRAATLIQALWKGYLVRSLLRSKRKKKGKGKKGGRK